MENNQSQVLSQFLDFFQTTNKQNFFIRVGQIFVLLISVFLYNQQDALISVWKETRLEDVNQKIKDIKQKEYPIIVKEQVQVQFQVVRPDVVAVYEYVPLSKNNFAKMIDYEGQLPDGMSIHHLQNIPINKTQKEYVSHLIGNNFSGPAIDGAILLDQKYIDMVKKVYSCPIYNLDNIHSGQLVFVWFNNIENKIINEEVLEAQCMAQTRILGRSK